MGPGLNALVSVPSEAREGNVMGWVEKLGVTDVLAVHAALLPTGKILHFSGSEYNPDNHNQNRNDHTRLYDCVTGEVTPVGSPVQDLFCCGHALLARSEERRVGKECR